MKMNVKLNNHHILAYTLVEVLVGLAIMMIVFLGIFQAISVYVNHNLSSAFRNEAVKIAHECAEKLRNLEFCTTTSSLGDPLTGYVVRTFRNVQKTFTIVYPNPLNFDAGQSNLVTIRVSYDYLGKNYLYQFTTVIYRPSS